MTMLKVFVSIVCILFLTARSSKSQTDNISPSARIENEYKLTVPDSSADQIWKYLQQVYHPQSPFLKSIDSSFQTRFSIEVFTDQYFDNEDMELQKNQNGIRHRIRKVLSDTTSKKNKRELIQIKLNSIDNNPLNRAEYKFPVQYYSIQEDSLNNLPFLGMVKMDKRPELIGLLKSHNINAYTLLPAVKLIQNRRRVYISKDSIDFATITLDDVTAELNHKTAHFTEIEIELNEIAYTRSDSTQRIVMEQINQKMKNDLMARFSCITQDQTPKYNKAYALLLKPIIENQASTAIHPAIKYFIILLVFVLFILGIIQIKNSNI